MAGTIESMFRFDTIDLPNVTANGASYNGTVPTLSENITAVAPSPARASVPRETYQPAKFVAHRV